MTELSGVHLYTLGCKANQYESNRLREDFAARGYPAVASPDRARVIVINSCCVTLTAEGKSRRSATRFRRRNPGALIVLAGCLASLGHDTGPAVDLVVPQAEKHRTAELVVARIGEGKSGPAPSSPARTRTMLKVQDGCERRCSYCIIPDLRGPEVSRPLKELTEEVARIAAGACREIVLSGMVLGNWQEGGLRFRDLLEELLRIPGFRLRISSLDVRDTSEELLRFLVRHPRICRHFHLPLQSGSARILAAMNRQYPPEDFAQRVRLIHEIDPLAAVTTDVICGFPGETDDDFAATQRLLDGLPLFDLHVFPFSARPGTVAASLPDPVGETEKRRRVESLLALAPRLRQAHFQRNLGQTRDVLVERRSSGRVQGLTDNYIPVQADAEARVGELVALRLSAITGDGMRGEEI